jgi:hypothetical protein
MRPVSIILSITLVALNGFLLSPASNRFHPYVLVASLVVALALLALMLVSRGERAAAKSNSTEPANPLPTPATASNQAEAEIVSLLAILQERGRLVDFLMEDITAYDDAKSGPPLVSYMKGARLRCRNISEFDRCAKRVRDHPSPFPRDIQPMNIA